MRVPHEAYAFHIRQQFALPALLCAAKEMEVIAR
jgi:hypothetical protein